MSDEEKIGAIRYFLCAGIGALLALSSGYYIFEQMITDFRALIPVAAFGLPFAFGAWWAGMFSDQMPFGGKRRKRHG